jgi:hypothetical protein
VDTHGELFNGVFWFWLAEDVEEAPNVKSLSSSEVINTNCNGSRKELALYPADSLHISKTLNPFDIPNTIVFVCHN